MEEYDGTGGKVDCHCPSPPDPLISVPVSVPHSVWWIAPAPL